MIRIAHRGNYKGRNAERENTVSYIEEAIAAGYDVEVDVRLVDGKWYLGHDKPQEEVSLSFLERASIWAHAKNLEGYVTLWNNKLVQTFWHDRDEFVFTSKGIKWARSGVVTHDGIMVMPDSNTELCEQIRSGALAPLGVCSDDFRKLIL